MFCTVTVSGFYNYPNSVYSRTVVHTVMSYVLSYISIASLILYSLDKNQSLPLIFVKIDRKVDLNIPNSMIQLYLMAFY